MTVQSGPPLTWLFEAEFTDGTVYCQTPDDRSQDHPERSCFTDVLTLCREFNKKIQRFGLFRGSDYIIVDLTSGRFQVNGLPFIVPVPPPDAELALWYTRTRTIHRQIGVNGDFEGDREDPLIYNIGWTCEHRGQHHEQILSVM